MHKLNFLLQRAEGISDPKQRALVLAGGAVDEIQTMQLLARVLQEAENAALSIENVDERNKALATIRRVFDRFGYNPIEKSFSLPSQITA